MKEVCIVLYSKSFASLTPAYYIVDVTTPGVGIHGIQLEMDSVREVWSASFNKQVFRRTNLVDPRQAPVHLYLSILELLFHVSNYQLFDICMH